MFSGLLIGAMLPYWFSAMTMKSVGKAALAMMEEVRRQFATMSGLTKGTARPHYRQFVEDLYRGEPPTPTPPFSRSRPCPHQVMSPLSTP